MQQVTKDQAAAFLEAMTGSEEANQEGDPCGRDKSPHVLTHLRSVLGISKVPYSYTFQQRSALDNADRVRAMIAYLRGVCDALEAELPDDPNTPPPNRWNAQDLAKLLVAAKNSAERIFRGKTDQSDSDDLKHVLGRFDVHPDC